MKPDLHKSDQRNSRMDYSVPILMYHLVSSRPYKNYREYTIQTDVFNKQIYWIQRLGYKSITLDTFQKWKDGSMEIPNRPIIITFDDGYKDCLQYAVPILTKYSMSAVFYLVAGKIGDKSTWNSMESSDIALMDWEGVHEIQSSGFQIGSHTMSHPRLIELSEKTCRKEIFESKNTLENKLGIEIKHFSYPYGLYNDQVREIVAESVYITATSIREGFSDRYDDSLALRRICVSGFDSFLDFIFKLKFGLNLKDFLRNCVKLRKKKIIG